MKFLECKGTPTEVGRQQGESLREWIQQRWEQDVQPSVANAVAKKPGVVALIPKALEKSVAYMNANQPEIVEEIRGIGEGAKISFDDALMLSTYNSLLFAVGGHCLVEQLSDGNGCSALAFAASSTGPFLFKTYDPFGSKEINSPAKRREKAEVENRHLFVLKATYASGVTMLGVRIAGSIWTETGVNNHGLGFAAASLHPRLYPQQASAVPQHCIGTIAINGCRTTAEVRDLMKRTPVFGKGYAMAFADKSGDCVGVEKTANFTGFNEAKDGLAFQTNHLRSEALVKRGREQDPQFWSGSYFKNSSARVQRIEQRLPRWKQETRLDSLVNDLFHAGEPGDLIQNSTEQCQYWITTWGGLAFPRTGELWIAEELPEEKKFQKWKL